MGRSDTQHRDTGYRRGLRWRRGPRRVEFAIARLTGLSRTQVVGMALWESLTVVTVGVAIGAVAAGGAMAGATVAISDIVGTRVLVAPWLLFVIVTIGVAAVVGVSSVLTTLAATSQPAVVSAGSRE